MGDRFDVECIRDNVIYYEDGGEHHPHSEVAGRATVTAVDAAGRLTGVQLTVDRAAAYDEQGRSRELLPVGAEVLFEVIEGEQRVRTTTGPLAGWRARNINSVLTLEVGEPYTDDAFGFDKPRRPGESWLFDRSKLAAWLTARGLLPLGESAPGGWATYVGLDERETEPCHRILSMGIAEMRVVLDDGRELDRSLRNVSADCVLDDGRPLATHSRSLTHYVQHVDGTAPTRFVDKGEVRKHFTYR